MIDRIWRERRFAAAILVTLLFTQVLAASDPGQGRAVYLIALQDAPLVENATKRVSVGTKVPAGGRQAMRDALMAPQSAAYLAQLDAGRNRVIDLASRAIARPLVPTQVYTHAANGMALELTHAEADKIAALAGVASVRRERILHVHTDAGPQWIGADGLWSGQAGPTTKGEGVVIGVIDTGINPTHPSFAATGADGFTHTNPGAGYLGLCASGQAACNGKLIGIYDYSNEGSNGIDVAGHGSHVSAIAAGNAISASLHGMTANLTRNVSGVAPHANLIMYKACNAKPIDASQGDGTCAESWLVKAIDQAIVDKVDVINYSIGGDTVDPYTLLADRSSDAYAFFQARAAGIVIAVAAGNEGPGANTLSEPSNAPWVIGVANASHNRRLTNTLTGTTGTGAGSSFNDLVGQGFTAGYGPAAVVYAGDHGNALCGKGTSVPSPPDGSSNPWPAGTFHGEIVICDRGTYGRVEKGFNLMVAGAGGMILANAASDGESTVSDDHYLPAVHLGYQEGQVIKDWAHSYAPLRSSISGVSAQLDAAFGDVLEASSSRGPYGFSGGVLKPDLTAPGTNILSASNTGNGLALMTGTSMASPHVAGSAALVLAAHHGWTPASRVRADRLGTRRQRAQRGWRDTGFAVRRRQRPRTTGAGGKCRLVSAFEYRRFCGVGWRSAQTQSPWDRGRTLFSELQFYPHHHRHVGWRHVAGQRHGDDGRKDHGHAKPVHLGGRSATSTRDHGGRQRSRVAEQLDQRSHRVAQDRRRTQRQRFGVDGRRLCRSRCGAGVRRYPRGDAFRRDDSELVGPGTVGASGIHAHGVDRPWLDDNAARRRSRSIRHLQVTDRGRKAICIVQQPEYPRH